MRCTAPIKAPRPPPTMPSRSRRATPPSGLPSMVIALSSTQAQHAPVRGDIGAGGGKIVERLAGRGDDVVGDERGAFGGALLGVLQRAFPLQHGPAVEIVLRELGEDAAEIDLPVAQGAEAAG